MFDLTILDYIYIGLILVSTVWASIRGGVYETVTMISWLAAALVARFVSPYLNELFQSWFKLPEPTIGTLVASYFIIFFVILVAFSFFNQKLRDRVQESMMRVTDHTLGIVFGIIRGIVVMGIVYWGLLWYYSEMPLPSYIADARTRPIMQLTAVQIHKWFIPGHNKLLDADMTGAESAQSVYENLINPKVQSLDAKQTDDSEKPVSEKPENAKAESSAATDKAAEESDANAGTGYKDSERDLLENKLLQIESIPE
ncbi:MAG: CvpA family protein [Rickettsiales bacterium]|jgi:membrane protein required for colicin V production|nr:CvpA family protein [Rickettsiales bacterium]